MPVRVGIDQVADILINHFGKKRCKGKRNTLRRMKIKADIRYCRI